PKGSSPISAASKSFTIRGSGRSPPASTIRMILSAAPWGAMRSQRPAASSTCREGCRKAVVRRSAPASASSVTGGAGSTQITRNPAEPKAAAAVSPATPPPEIRMSVVSTMALRVRGDTILRPRVPATVRASRALLADRDEDQEREADRHRRQRDHRQGDEPPGLHRENEQGDDDHQKIEQVVRGAVDEIAGNPAEERDRIIPRQAPGVRTCGHGSLLFAGPQMGPTARGRNRS